VQARPLLPFADSPANDELMRRIRHLLVGLALAACGADEDPGPSPALRDDLTQLHLLIDRDPAVDPLDLAERRVDEDRPVHAANTLETSGIPAARRQVEAVRAAELSTAEGRRFQRRLRDAYQARLDALGPYQQVLSGGVAADTVELLDAMRGVRVAQEQLLEVVREMNDRLGMDQQRQPVGNTGPGSGDVETEEPSPPPGGSR